MSQAKVVENIETPSCTITYFRKSCRLLDEVKKYCIVKQVTDDNMAHSHCIPKATNTHTHTHTYRVCYTHCFFHCNRGYTKTFYRCPNTYGAAI